MTQIRRQQQDGQVPSKPAGPLIEDIQKPKVMPGKIIDLGKGLVLPITTQSDRKTAYLLSWQACNVALNQLKSDRSEDFDFRDQMQDLTKPKVFLGQRTIQVLKSFEELDKEKRLGLLAEIMEQYLTEMKELAVETKRKYHRPPNEFKRKIERFNAIETVERDTATRNELADRAYDLLVENPRLSNKELAEILQKEFKGNNISEDYISDLMELAYKRHPDLYEIRGADSVDDVIETIRTEIKKKKPFSNKKLKSMLAKAHPKNSFSDYYVRELVRRTYNKYPELKEIRRATKATFEQLVDSAHSIMMADPGMSRRKTAEKLHEMHPNNPISLGRMGCILNSMFKKYPEFKELREKALGQDA